LGSSVDDHQGMGSPRGGTGLQPGARVMPARRGNLAALPNVVGALAVLHRTGGGADGARTGRAAPHPGPACPRSHAPCGGLPCAGTQLILAGRVGRGPYAPGAGDHPLRLSAAPLQPALWRARPRVLLPALWGLDPVGVGLSGPGPTAEL